MKVAVIGLGYVGTVTAACLAANGHEVAGVDTDTAKVAEIRAGRSPVAEPGLADLVRDTVAEGGLTATTSCREALDGAVLSLVCVGTPSLADGATDLSHVRKAVGQIAAALEEARSAPSQEHTVVIRSTVPPGTTEDVVLPALAASRGHQRLKVSAGMCPEFLREGSGVADFYGAPFVVAGTRDPHAARAMASLFGFLPAPVHVVPPRVAESLKYACNAFHATKVSFANEVSRVLRPLGVDAREVMSLLCADGVLSISAAYLRPGFAFGGSCLPKDLRSLLQVARVHGADLPLLAGALATNERVIGDAVDRVLAWDGHTVALLGLSFKMHTDDLRESPNVELAERLIGKGFEVRIYDPVVHPGRLAGANRRYVEAKLPHLRGLLAHEPADALRGADIAIVSSADPAVADALVRHPPSHVLDLSGALGSAVESLPGYQGLGW